MKENVAVYLKLKDDISTKIHSGVYKKDMRLPSENALCKEWGISRMTVRRALDELVREGLVYRTRGSGTFVAANRFSQCDIMNFSESLILTTSRSLRLPSIILRKLLLCPLGSCSIL